MTENNQTWDIGEFAEYVLKDDDKNKRFTISISGPHKYRDLLATKIGDIRITQQDLQKWVEQ